MTTKEVTSRAIPGNGGTVSWSYDKARNEHVVTVTALDGYLAGAVATHDATAARTFFDHPFATAAVADIFSRKVGSDD